MESEATIKVRNKSIRHGFQVVNKKVDIPCDGILGRDFHKRARAKIC
jgi:hypothetical protein